MSLPKRPSRRSRTGPLTGLASLAILLLILSTAGTLAAPALEQGPSAHLGGPFNGSAVLSNSTYEQTCSHARIPQSPSLNLTLGVGGVRLASSSHSCRSSPRVPLNGTVSSVADENASVGGWFPLAYASGNPSIFVNFSYHSTYSAGFARGTCGFVLKFTGRAYTYDCIIYSGSYLGVDAWIMDNTSGRIFSFIGPSQVAGTYVENDTACYAPTFLNGSCSNYTTGSWGNTAIRGNYSWRTNLTTPFVKGHRYFLYFTIDLALETGWIEQDARLSGASVGASFSAAESNHGLRLLQIVET